MFENLPSSDITFTPFEKIEHDSVVGDFGKYHVFKPSKRFPSVLREDISPRPYDDLIKFVGEGGGAGTILWGPFIRMKN